MIKQALLKDLVVLRNKGVIDEEHYKFLKRKIESASGDVLLERIMYVFDYFIAFYKENNYEKK